MSKKEIISAVINAVIKHNVLQNHYKHKTKGIIFGISLMINNNDQDIYFGSNRSMNLDRILSESESQVIESTSQEKISDFATICVAILNRRLNTKDTYECRNKGLGLDTINEVKLAIEVADTIVFSSNTYTQIIKFSSEELYTLGEAISSPKIVGLITNDINKTILENQNGQRGNISQEIKKYVKDKTTVILNEFNKCISNTHSSPKDDNKFQKFVQRFACYSPKNLDDNQTYVSRLETERNSVGGSIASTKR